MRRRPCSARAPYDDERLSALEALHGYTTWAAATVGEKSPLTVGAGADLIIFGVDSVDCRADDPIDTAVLLTVVGGEIVRRAI